MPLAENGSATTTRVRRRGSTVGALMGGGGMATREQYARASIGPAPHDGIAAVAVALAALGLYVACLPPSFAFWDTGELQTVAAILGIAHPPACPAFVLLGWLATRVVPFGDPAWRVTLVSALSLAASAGLAFATARRLGAATIFALLGALAFATASVVWRDATRAEIQALETLLRAAALWFALAYLDRGRVRDALGSGLALGLAGATHGIALLAVPSVALLIGARFVRGRSARRATRAVAVGLLLGLLPYAYLPLRSAYVAAHGLDPTVAIGLPPGLPFWNYDDPHTWHGFVRVVTGADFDVHSGFAGYLDPGDYRRDIAALTAQVAGAFGAPAAWVALGGLVALGMRRPAVAVALFCAALLPVPYTRSYADLQDPTRYYLLALWVAAVATALGLGAVLDLLRTIARLPRVAAYAVASAAALIVAWSCALSAPDRGKYFAQRRDRTAPRYVAAVLAATPSNAIVVAEWAWATPLAYAAYVQHELGDRVVVSASPTQFESYYPGWLRERPVYLVTFDPALHLRDFVVTPVLNGSFHEYRLEPRASGA